MENKRKNLKNNVRNKHTEDEAYSQKDRKKARKKFRVGRLLTVIFALIYVPSLFYWFYGNSIATDIIRIGKIEDSINVNALLVRDETVLKAPFNGEYIPHVEEGNKISAYSTVATVVDDSSLKLLKEINDINTKILAAQKEKNKNKEIFNQDIVKIENEIGRKVKLIVAEMNSNRLSRIKQIKYEIDELIKKKAEIIGDDGIDSIYIKTLKEQRDKLMKNMNTSISEKKTDSSGIVSYIVDGYESILKPQAIGQLTPEVFESILTEKTVERDISDRKVEADKPFAKVINDFQYQIVVCLKSEQNTLLEKGKKLLIRINDINRKMTGTVEFVSKEQDGKQIIAIRADKYTGEIAGLRRVNIDLVKSSYEGLTVPLKSLRNVDLNMNTAEIVILKGDIASVREVKIIGRNNEYAVVEAMDRSKGIYLYDTYILNPHNIQDGQVIN
ncbi:MAG: hypothetical protein HPY74_06660 [Firmicutes bacterium]|nr:hypothetical protein [Bacillota bacterium]